MIEEYNETIAHNKGHPTGLGHDEDMDDTGLHIPDKIINHNWDWVF